MSMTEQRELLNRSKQSFGGASLIEAAESTVSFDMFKGLDSISQADQAYNEFDSAQMEQFDLGAVKYELQAREKKIKELLSEKSKMKALLKKAKAAVETINSKQKLSEQKAAMMENERNLLQRQLTELQKRRNGIEKSQVAQILCRVKVGEMGYTLIQDV